MQTVIGLIGDTRKIDIDLLAGLEIIDSVTRITDPFKSANRSFHPEDTVVTVGKGENQVKIGGGNFAIMAGPCSVESEEQILTVARAVKASGARSRFLPSHAPLRHRVRISCVAVLSNPAHRPMTSRDCVPRVCSYY